MRILFMAQCYAPEDVSAAVLITELTTDLARRGHQVGIVTSAPNYPHGRVYDGYRNHLYQCEDLNDVRVIRTWSYIAPSKKFWSRLLHYGTYSATAFYGGLMAGRPDMLVSFSPPLPLGLSARLLSKIWHVPWVLQLEDLYPDAAIAAGVMNNSKVIWFFLAMEKFLYRTAHHISVISEGFRRSLLRKQVSDSKITMIPVWADPNLVRPMPKSNAFRHQYGLDDKFVVMYAGNIGLTSCLEDIIYAAEDLRDQADIQFVIIGEGTKKESLKSEVESRRLTNIRFLPYQPREIFSEMLAAADISLVTLNLGASLSSLPSKVFNLMASARPILAITPCESELAGIVSEAKCGWIVPPGSPAVTAALIAQSTQQHAPLGQMGQNGRAYLEKNYSRQHCVDAYEKMLNAVYNLHKQKPAQVRGLI